jgi:hypothetical protein
MRSESTAVPVVTGVLTSRRLLQSDSVFLEIESFERFAKSFDEFLRTLTPQAQNESRNSSLVCSRISAMLDCIKATLAKRLQEK